VPVGFALRDELGRDGAVGAGLVLHHGRLAEKRLEFRTDGTTDDVRRAASDERDNHADGLGRKCLRVHSAAQGRENHAPSHQVCSTHE
jgi:hypothetical protein